MSYLTDGIIDPGDGSTKKWCAARSSNQAWFAEFSTAAPISVSSYTMTTANDAASYRNRNPKAWTLKAKLNASDGWTTIDTRNSYEALPHTNYTATSFDVATSGTYQYFRLDITENDGEDNGGGENLIQLSEFSIQTTRSALPKSDKPTRSLNRSRGFYSTPTVKKLGYADYGLADSNRINKLL